MGNEKVNILFYLVDQLRACSLPLYGETQIQTPNIDRLASEGVTLTNSISSCPVCTPYRGMLLTGRHPQTTGHVINSICTRHSELSIADAFAKNGYNTGYVGKWHLHTGAWPANDVPDWVPKGRDRLGFEYWKGYNQHMIYFNGYYNGEDWNAKNWEGYEPFGLNKLAFEFLEKNQNDPFCLFVSPQPPHFTNGKFAPDKYYNLLPKNLKLPDNVPEDIKKRSLKMYRNYLAMILAIDESLGEMLDYLEEKGLKENTLIVFASDHGTQAGSHGIHPWEKRSPYEESLKVPFILRLPEVLEGGEKRDTLTAPVDIFPSLCGIAGIKVPRSVEGYDLSESWEGKDEAHERESVFTMNFSNINKSHDHFVGGNEWRGVRTKNFSYAKWLNGKEVLYNIHEDPLQENNLVNDKKHKATLESLRSMLYEHQKERGDKLVPCEHYKEWVDNKRRVIKNAYGPLSNPEGEPDWSLLF